jgi:putative endonuclease
MPDRMKKGLDGESCAAAYLESQGFRVLERNYRFGHKEIDLIAQRDDLVIFVEVKLRLSESFGPACTSITMRKRRNLVAAAEGYLFERGLGGVPNRYRFDVILLHPPAGDRENRLEHITDAFRP